MGTKRWMTSLFGAAMLVVALGGVQSAQAKGKIDQQLTPVSDADAGGRVRLAVRKASDGRFEIKVDHLDANTSYDLLVNGVKVATLTTNDKGKAKARFRSRPRGNDQLLGFDPRGALVVVRNAAGQDALIASFPTTPPSNSGPSDDGKVVCCVPDDDGTECEDRTPTECSDRGGVVSAATSCLPNPCEGSTPPIETDVVCCIPDDSGPECEDRTTAECSAQGGIAIAASSCIDNPCAGTASAEPGIMCCVPHHSGSELECEDRTEAECAAEGGTSKGAGVCAVDTCTAPAGAFSGESESGHGRHGGGNDSTYY